MKTNLATLLAAQQAALDLTDTALAEALGFGSPRVVAMIKNGSMRLPINKVAPLATALQTDPFELLRMVLTEQSPDLWKAIEAITPLGALRPWEINLVRHLRKLHDGRDCAPMVIEGRAVVALVVA